MEFHGFSIGGILNLFKNGYLKPEEIIAASDAVLHKIKAGERMSQQDIWIYKQFCEITRRTRTSNVQTRQQRSTPVAAISQDGPLDLRKITQAPAADDVILDLRKKKTSLRDETHKQPAKLVTLQSPPPPPPPPPPMHVPNDLYVNPQPSTSACHDLQQGTGMRSELNYLTIISDSVKTVKKFNTVMENVTYKFKDVNDNAAPLEWLKLAFDELVAYVTRTALPSDFIGMALRNSNYSEKPIGISFRRVEQLNSDVILNLLANILQSNAQFFAQDIMNLQVSRIRIPVGRGREKLAGFTFQDFCEKKKGIVTVLNNDNKCLAAAIIIAIAFKTNDPEYENLKLGKTVLELRVNRLCMESGVDLSNGGGYAEVQKFQDFLQNYTIIVYDSRKGDSTFFEGPRYANRIIINLLMENDHFNVITSLTSAFTTSYFCELCKSKYNNKNGHKRCLYTCSACQTSPPCSLDAQKVVCCHCNRDFYGDLCFNEHKRSNLCQKLFRCVSCLHTVWVNSKIKHKCGHSFCIVCKKQQRIRHLCYMARDEKIVKRSKTEFIFVFYDIESRQETIRENTPNVFLHEPNLCIASQACVRCIENEDVTGDCLNCGKRLNIFSGDDAIIKFLDFISKLGKKFKVTGIAHNMRGYDGCFVLKEIIRRRSDWDPKIITNGLKLISITCGRIRFIDSLNYMPLPLAKLPSAFNFEESKGYFPYLFNTTENQNYVGPLPAVEFYCPDSMSCADREKFLKWHAQEIASGTVFNMQRDIVEYCKMDVQILKKACIRFWKLFKEENGVDCFQEATTIASSCNLVYRRRFLQNNTIGLIPPGGYRLADKQSKIGLQWLSLMEVRLGVDIQHGGKAREFRLEQGMLVDGYCRETNTVFEFLGCFWHGCSRCYPVQAMLDDRDKMNAMFLRREYTEARSARIRQLGYNVEEMWECDFVRHLKNNDNDNRYVENLDILKIAPLNPRECFYGGRTNAVQLHYKCAVNEKIMYFDVCSLYPYVNKYFKYPVGHPTIYIGHEECSRLNFENLEGLIKCKVLPPRGLYHPVLPCRMHNKLMFVLCRMCGEILNSNICTHTDTERSFVGVFVADELRKAVELDYKIIEFYEVWVYIIEQYDKDNRSGGLFSGYIDTFLKAKQECSGWPLDCNDPFSKNQYISDYFIKEGIQLDVTKIENNPGRRYLAKLMLNSFWGKFGQRENMVQTSVVYNPSKLFDLLVNPAVELCSMVAVDDETLMVSWKKHDEDVSSNLKTVNVVIAAYTTAHARLELYSYLEKLNKRVLYFDTDSIIFTQKEGEWMPEKGSFLGQMTDEIECYGSDCYISEFVSGGPKNYAFNIYSPSKNTNKTIVKVKGISLNFRNREKINFEKMIEMICNNGEPVYVTDDRKIVRSVTYDVFSKPESKVYRLKYNKRMKLANSYETLPFGF